MNTDIKPLDHDVLLFTKYQIADAPQYINAAQQMAKLTRERPKSLIEEVRLYRKYVPLLLEHILLLSDVNKAATKECTRVYEKTDVKSNKRWSKEEDELLIEAVCDDNTTMAQLSAIFGRTPGAINSHLTKLVGLKRLSQKVVGKFIGEVDGQTVNTSINGTLYKE